MRKRAMRGRAPAILLACLFVALGAAQAGSAAVPPAPCLGVPQITDAPMDGHHPHTDVLSGWFSEEAGSLQAVIKVRVGQWLPEHDDADLNGTGYALLFNVGALTKYVRLRVDPDGASTYDYGTYTLAGHFATLGATTGVKDAPVFTDATTTIDVPAATGATDGVLLDNPYLLTYDGITGGVPDWVDQGPGATLPTDTARGADYVVGSCDDDPDTTVAVQLSAPAGVTGGKKTATVTGTILPERGGVNVELTREGATTAVSNVVTEDDGTFSVTIPVRETTRLRATAEGISSQTLTVTVQSTVHIAARRVGVGTRITGTVAPRLPGRVLLLRTTAFNPAQRMFVKPNGRFAFTIPKRAKPGRFQVVFIPSGGRAERSTSNTVRVR